VRRELLASITPGHAQRRPAGRSTSRLDAPWGGRCRAKLQGTPSCCQLRWPRCGTTGVAAVVVALGVSATGAVGACTPPLEPRGAFRAGAWFQPPLGCTGRCVRRRLVGNAEQLDGSGTPSELSASSARTSDLGSPVSTSGGCFRHGSDSTLARDITSAAARIPCGRPPTSMSALFPIRPPARSSPGTGSPAVQPLDDLPFDQWWSSGRA